MWQSSNLKYSIRAQVVSRIAKTVCFVPQKQGVQQNNNSPIFVHICFLSKTSCNSCNIWASTCYTRCKHVYVLFVSNRTKIIYLSSFFQYQYFIYKTWISQRLAEPNYFPAISLFKVNCNFLIYCMLNAFSIHLTL